MAKGAYFSRGTTLVLASLALILPLTGRTGHLFRGQLRGSNFFVRSFHHPASLVLKSSYPHQRSNIYYITKLTFCKTYRSGY